MNSTPITTDTADTAAVRDTAGARLRLERRVPTSMHVNNMTSAAVSGH